MSADDAWCIERCVDPPSQLDRLHSSGSEAPPTGSTPVSLSSTIEVGSEAPPEGSTSATLIVDTVKLVAKHYRRGRLL